jgi:hypothetical protein
MKRDDGALPAVQTERWTGSPLTVQGLGMGLKVEEILALLQEGRRVEEFRGFLGGIDTAVEREPDRF